MSDAPIKAVDAEADARLAAIRERFRALSPKEQPKPVIPQADDGEIIILAKPIQPHEWAR